MKTELQFAMFALALAVSGPALAQDNKASIVGAWRMTSLQFTNSEGSLAEVPYSGQVIFSQSGSLGSGNGPGSRRKTDHLHGERL